MLRFFLFHFFLSSSAMCFRCFFCCYLCVHYYFSRWSRCAEWWDGQIPRSKEPVFVSSHMRKIEHNWNETWCWRWKWGREKKISVNKVDDDAGYDRIGERRSGEMFSKQRRKSQRNSQTLSCTGRCKCFPSGGGISRGWWKRWTFRWRAEISFTFHREWTEKTESTGRRVVLGWSPTSSKQACNEVETILKWREEKITRTDRKWKFYGSN